MDNSFSVKHPELVPEWSERNSITPDMITFGSNKMFWWKGNCGHEWQASPKSRSSGENCPICAGKKVVQGINDLETLKPELAAEWSPKNTIKPSEVTIGSNKKVSKDEQDLFLNYLRNNHQYNHWYPVFAVMLGTGLRVGEISGLRWCDIDFEAGFIDINHTLVYYSHREDAAKNGSYFNVHTPKTKAGYRQVPIIQSVKEAILMEKEYQERMGIECQAVIDGYTDFVFLNQNGKTYQQTILNKAIRRIIRDCNDEVLLKDEEDPVLLPHFTCHSLRHSFATRMCEAGINIKVMQDTLGHKDISTTMNIYTDATKKLKLDEFQELQRYLTDEQ